MATPLRLAYNGFVIPAARLLRPVAGRFSPRIGAGIEARRGVLERWEAAARGAQGRSPRAWLHAASAGETLQARPLAEAIRMAHPGAAIFYSFFSPSAERYVEDWGAPDAADYLPLDVAGWMRRMIEALRPDALVLTGAEVWPNLVWESAGQGVPAAQACCRFGVNAGRLRWPARALTRDLYRRFAAIAAVAESDADVLGRLGVAPERIAVAGDTRVDVTLERAEAARGEPPPWRPPGGRGPVVVAGSTWPADEALVVPAVAELARRHPGLVAVLAPHEPTAPALARLGAEARAAGLRTARLSSLEAGEVAPEEPLVVLVDRVGVLYRLYGIAGAAYVGGGLTGSVHNTMEPAAMGVPVAVGPAHGGPHEVEALERAGGLKVVTTPAELAAAWEGWTLEGGRAGEAALATIRRLAGATGRTLGFFRDRGLAV